MLQVKRGETIHVMPYGAAIVDKLLDNGRVLATIDRVIKRLDGSLTNQVIVELHPVWIAREGV